MKHVLPTIISLLIITPIGFYSKFYQGPAQHWINDSLGGVFYVIFWCLVAYLFFPRIAVMKIAVGVVMVTCLLECLQVWHPPFLEYLRGNFIGATILGSTFMWTDFPYYIVGGLLGWGWIWFLKLRVDQIVM